MYPIEEGTGSESSPENDGAATGDSPESQGSETANAHEGEAEETPTPEELMEGMSFEDLQKALNNPPKKKRPEGQDDDEDEEEGDDEDADGEGAETDETEGEEDEGEPGGEDDEQEEEEQEQAPDPKAPAKNYRFTKVTDPKLAKFLSTLRKGVSVEAAAVEAGYSLAQAKEAAGADATTTQGKAKGATAEEIAAQAATRTAEVLKPHTDKVATLKSEIEALEKLIVEKDSRYEKFSKESIALGKKEMELYRAETALDQAKAKHEAGEHWMADYTRTKSAAIAKSIELYPETGKKGSPQYWMVMAARTQLETEDPNFINDPNYALKVIAKLEEEMPTVFNKKAAGKGKKADIRNEVVQGAPPKKAAREVGGKAVSGNRTANIKLTVDNIDAMLDKMSPEELSKLGDLVGTQPKKRAS